eukprot:4449685-Pleurochrysis_carterae.AAC.1
MDLGGNGPRKGHQHQRQGRHGGGVDCAQTFWYGHGPQEVKNDAYSGLLARVRGSPDLKALRASRSSRVGSKNKEHLK